MNPWIKFADRYPTIEELNETIEICSDIEAGHIYPIVWNGKDNSHLNFALNNFGWRFWRLKNYITSNIWTRFSDGVPSLKGDDQIEVCNCNSGIRCMFFNQTEWKQAFPEAHLLSNGYYTHWRIIPLPATVPLPPPDKKPHEDEDNEAWKKVQMLPLESKFSFIAGRESIRKDIEKLESYKGEFNDIGCWLCHCNQPGWFNTWKKLLKLID